MKLFYICSLHNIPRCVLFFSCVVLCVFFFSFYSVHIHCVHNRGITWENAYENLKTNAHWNNIETASISELTEKRETGKVQEKIRQTDCREMKKKPYSQCFISFCFCSIFFISLRDLQVYSFSYSGCIVSDRFLCRSFYSPFIRCTYIVLNIECNPRHTENEEERTRRNQNDQWDEEKKKYDNMCTIFDTIRYDTS